MLDALRVQIAAQKLDERIEVTALSPDGTPLSGSGYKDAVRFRVRWASGRELLVDARRGAERGEVTSWTLLDAAGRQRVVDVAGRGSDLKVSVAGGEALSVQATDERSRDASALGKGVGQTGELRAAMPGKVVKVLGRVGDSVKAGQALLVIEAMKMENELRAPGSGKITAIGVSEGQAVDAGQILVQIAAE